MKKKNALFSLLRSRETRKNARSASERLKGKKPTALERSLPDEAVRAAQVAYDLAVIGRDDYGRTVDPNEIAAAAMFHDVWGGEKPAYKAIFGFDTDPSEFALYLRAADLIVSYLHCVEEVRRGNGAYESAEVQLLEGIYELELPEAEEYLARLHGGAQNAPEEFRQEEEKQ